MGTEYYVIDTSAKTFYLLGKGRWYTLNDDKEAFQDQGYLVLYILEKCYCLSYLQETYGNQEVIELEGHVRSRIAPDLFQAFGHSQPEHLHIVDDCGDDLTICKAKGYRCVGTRYNERGDARYEEDLARMNRHLNDPFYKHLYDPEKHKQYPEWEMY